MQSYFVESVFSGVSNGVAVVTIGSAVASLCCVHPDKKWNQSVQKQVEIICQERDFIISFQVLFYLSSSARKLHNKCIEAFVQRAQSLRNHSWFIIFPFFVSELHTCIHSIPSWERESWEKKKRRKNASVCIQKSSFCAFAEQSVHGRKIRQQI